MGNRINFPPQNNYNSNKRQYTIGINLDDKYQMHQWCTFLIRSELKWKMHENTVCVCSLQGQV